MCARQTWVHVCATYGRRFECAEILKMVQGRRLLQSATTSSRCSWAVETSPRACFAFGSPNAGPSKGCRFILTLTHLGNSCTTLLHKLHNQVLQPRSALNKHTKQSRAPHGRRRIRRQAPKARLPLSMLSAKHHRPLQQSCSRALTLTYRCHRRPSSSSRHRVAGRSMLSYALQQHLHQSAGSPANRQHQTPPFHQHHLLPTLPLQNEPSPYPSRHLPRPPHPPAPPPDPPPASPPPHFTPGNYGSHRPKSPPEPPALLSTFVPHVELWKSAPYYALTPTTWLPPLTLNILMPSPPHNRPGRRRIPRLTPAPTVCFQVPSGGADPLEAESHSASPLPAVL